ncbi:DUF5327 family protein [Salibacterium aidingense]|uniref:DUF5327 family protein n=1 Tax=Salibacterium aidingense TaxID=384933 RepID=UPI0004183899|nr:DUF5327 family protein [Salibacterium aidingense]
MNISARTVVHKMEEELLQLTDRLEQEEEQAVKNHARVLKAYCDIILGEGERTPMKTSGRISSRPSTDQVSAPSTGQAAPVPRQDLPSTEGNLLEF